MCVSLGATVAIAVAYLYFIDPSDLTRQELLALLLSGPPESREVSMAEAHEVQASLSYPEHGGYISDVKSVVVKTTLGTKTYVAQRWIIEELVTERHDHVFRRVSLEPRKTVVIQTCVGWPMRCLTGRKVRGVRPDGTCTEWECDGAVLGQRSGSEIVLPIRPIWLGLIVNTAVVTVCGVGALMVATRFRRIARRWRHRCPRCGYQLHGKGDGGCPECGWNRRTKRKC